MGAAQQLLSGYSTAAAVTPAAYRSHTTTTWDTRVNTVCTVPAGTVNGDVLLLFHVAGNSGSSPSITFPTTEFPLLTGFPNSPVIDSGGYQVVSRVGWRVAASEPANYTVTHGSYASQYMMTCISGAKAQAPAITYNYGDYPHSTGGTTTTALGLTAAANSLILFLVHNWQLYSTTSPPTGSTPTFTERSDVSTSLIYLASGLYAAGGATGNKTHGNRNGAGEPWVGLLLEFQTF